MEEMTFADLFAGAGGLSLGLEQAGLRPSFAVEQDVAAAMTHSANSGCSAIGVDPVQSLTGREAWLAEALAGRGLDVLAGGPPCQGFSLNAHERDPADPRNHLFRHFVRLAAVLRPRLIVMENVPGLAQMERGRTIRDVQQAFALAGYASSWRILCAAHYGVPQVRWRLFLIAVPFPEPKAWPWPIPERWSPGPVNFKTGGQLFSWAVRRPGFDAPPGLLPPVGAGEALKGLPRLASGGAWPGKPANHACAALSPANLERARHVKPGGSWRQIPPGLLPAGMRKARRTDHTGRYGRLHPSRPSGTILTKCDPHWGAFLHPSQDRVISVREAARLQGFPDSFVFRGNLTEQYRQVGNAVPPPLARAVALAALRLLGKRS